MVDGRCSKGFPKMFMPHTVIDGDQCKPVYRRRSPAQGGRQVVIKRGGQEFTVDNSMVVPHTPALVLRYSSHINTEVCTSAAGVKYLCGYVNKGHDKATAKVEVQGEERDEVREYVDTRVITANEAAAGVFGFDVHQSYPPVMPLRLHLQDEQVTLQLQKLSNNLR